MTNRVNPPKQLQLPASVAANPELKKAFDDRDFILFQLWKRVGGGADWIDEALQGLYEFDDLEKIDVKQAIEDHVAVVDSDYTTTLSETVVCTAPLTVFLNETPDNREQAKIKITNGDVTINAGSRKLDNEDSITIDFSEIQGLATLDCIYTIETDSWWII